MLHPISEKLDHTPTGTLQSCLDRTAQSECKVPHLVPSCQYRRGRWHVDLARWLRRRGTDVEGYQLLPSDEDCKAVSAENSSWKTCSPMSNTFEFLRRFYSKRLPFASIFAVDFHDLSKFATADLLNLYKVLLEASMSCPPCRLVTLLNR